MNRFSILLVILSLAMTIKAGPIQYVNSLPENGSNISEFSFTLIFDIEDAITEVGGGEWGIGYAGSASTSARNKNRTILYEGKPGSGVELARTLTTGFNGTSDGFEVGGNTVSITFPQSMKPEVGKSYYLEIGNIFSIFQSGVSSLNSATKLSFNDEPLILTFVGSEPTSQELVYQTSSVIADSEYESLDNVEFTFNAELNLVDGGVVTVMDNKVEQFSTTKLCLSEDGLSVKASFDKPVTLWKGHSYTIQLTAGSVCLASDANVFNKIVSVPVLGASTIRIPVKSTTPVDNSKGIYTELLLTFDIPEGYTLTVPKNYPFKNKGYLYVNEVSQENIERTLNCTITEDGTGQSFDLSSISSTPSTKYIFVKPENEITLWKDGIEAPEYGNEETSISWVTPSVEELALSTITTGTVKIGRHDSSSSPVFVDGGKYASINTIEFAKENYSYNGESISTTLDWKNLTCYVYDVTGGTRKVVKEMEIGAAQRETNYDYYGVFVIAPQMDFLEGHNYEIVIPKGVIRLNNYPLLYNYVTNDDIVLNLQGATPSEFKVESCSVENNAEMNVLPSAIVWKVYGSYELSSPGATASYRSGEIDSQLTSRAECPVTILKEGWNTYVAVQISDLRTGLPKTMRKGWFFTVTLPAGTLVYPGDETLANPELSLTILGADAPVIDPEFVNTTVTFADNESNESHSFVVETAKGYPAKIQLLPGENWNVADVAHEGKSLSAVNGVYSSEPLNEDSKIVATLAYIKDMTFTQSTGVYSVENTNIHVFSEDGQIIVSGLSEPTDIAVYTVGGILIKSMRTDAADEMVRITAEPNEIYVVVINGQAAKIKL